MVPTLTSTTVSMSLPPPSSNLTSRLEKYFAKVLTKVNFDIGARLSNFLATGNLISPTGLDLQQASGFTIVAEKLNWQRYISHFRCIHRGAFFAELKTTTVRKLLPEAWGKTTHNIAGSLAYRSTLQGFCALCIRLMARLVVCSTILLEPAASSPLH
jgi:RNA polymerase Rpb2, domain 3